MLDPKKQLFMYSASFFLIFKGEFTFFDIAVFVVRPRWATLWNTMGELPHTIAPVRDLGILINSRRLVHTVGKEINTTM
jgi:hypothetical protein